MMFLSLPSEQTASALVNSRNHTIFREASMSTSLHGKEFVHLKNRNFSWLLDVSQHWCTRQTCQFSSKSNPASSLLHRKPLLVLPFTTSPILPEHILSHESLKSTKSWLLSISSCLFQHAQHLAASHDVLLTLNHPLCSTVTTMMLLPKMTIWLENSRWLLLNS